MTKSQPIGVLVVQLGTPDSTDVKDVRRYLREFLNDPLVIDIPAPLRSLLLNGVILPFRPRKSAEQYSKIWTDEGSPLLIHTTNLAEALDAELGDGYRVAVGMRYQNPSIASALEQLTAAGCEQVVIAPMFPQYSSAAYGSAVNRALEVAASMHNPPTTKTLAPFYDQPGFIESVSEIAAPLIREFNADHVLFSYHGLPQHQVHAKDSPGAQFIDRPGCCRLDGPENSNCYRAQSYKTTDLVAAHLGLQEGLFSTAFQSRMAGTKWIEPYTDGVLSDLVSNGVRRLAVLTPSFTADCLETLEEIGIRLRTQWLDEGGEDLALIPCVNSTPTWTAALAGMVRELAQLPADV